MNGATQETRNGIEHDIEVSEEMLDFIQNSPSMFHTVATIRDYLDAEGFEYLPEQSKWRVTAGGSYYTVRNGSSIVAFKVGGNVSDNYHFQMAAAHSDSPTYKVKAVPELDGPAGYLRLNVEAYGGMIDNTWLDKPLGVAGRVLVSEDGKIASRLLDIEKDILLIPNLAIHMNHSINKGMEYNRQVDMCPLFSAGELPAGAFDEMIAQVLDVDADQILGKDLFLVNHQEPSIWGAADEFVSSPKLDDLQCAFAALKAFIASSNDDDVSVYACFDNEEVGSNTKQGAMSTFLRDVLSRANSALGYGSEDLQAAIAKSMMLSCDNAHAVHPNHPEKADAANHPLLNHGIVVKEAANQKYTTDAYSRAVFAKICNDAGIPIQFFANRSDSAGGSTLGNLSNIQVSQHSVDIGLPQLAMHSSYETTGVKDTALGIAAIRAFFDANVQIEDVDSVSVW